MMSGVMPREAISLLNLYYPFNSIVNFGSIATGKTESIRFFARNYKENQSISVVEDPPETLLNELYPHLNIKMLSNRDVELDDIKHTNQEYLVKTAIREDPDVLVIGELRGAEAAYVIETTYTSDIVVTTTLSAASMIEGYERLLELCQLNSDQSDEYYAKMISKEFKLGVHFERYNRKFVLNEISEIVGFENGKFKVNTIVRYNPITKQHEIVGQVSNTLWSKFEESYTDDDLSVISMFQPRMD